MIFIFRINVLYFVSRYVGCTQEGEKRPTQKEPSHPCYLRKATHSYISAATAVYGIAADASVVASSPAVTKPLHYSSATGTTDQWHGSPARSNAAV
jgi:hypothetical protein